jgi:Predicted transcriptional regulator
LREGEVRSEHDGVLLRRARLSRGIGLRALAAELGISAATLSQVENGRTPITLDRLRRIADALSLPVVDILEGRPSAPDRHPTRDAGAGWRHYPPLDLDPVLHAVLAEFLEFGYHGATVRRIAARADLSVSGIYHHYPSKQHMLLAVAQYTMSDLHARAEAARRESADSVERFCLLVENLALFHTYRHELAFVADSEMRSLTPANRRTVARLRTLQQRLVDAEVVDAVAAGRFRADHPHDASRTVVTMCTALAGWFRHDGPASPEQVARQYVGFALDLMRGATP